MRIAVTGSAGIPFVAEVHPGLERTCRRILAELADKAPSSPVPERLARDWYIVEMHRTAGEVVVCEPDYLGRLTSYLPSLNVTCAICDGQERLHAAVSAPRAPVRYDQGVVVEPGLFDDEVILATRSQPTRSDDSGWRLVRNVTGAPVKQWDALRLYQLVARRAIVVVGAQLPVDWSFRAAGNTIDEVATPDGKRTRAGVELRLPG